MSLFSSKVHYSIPCSPCDFVVIWELQLLPSPQVSRIYMIRLGPEQNSRYKYLSSFYWILLLLLHAHIQRKLLNWRIIYCMNQSHCFPILWISVSRQRENLKTENRNTNKCAEMVFMFLCPLSYSWFDLEWVERADVTLEGGGLWQFWFYFTDPFSLASWKM